MGTTTPDARALYVALTATDREAGTPAAALARRQIRGHLESLGFQVTEHPFRFLPGALNALPLLGAGLVWLALLELPLLLLPAIPGFGAALVWLTGATAVALLAWRIGSGVPMPGAEEREDANLVAARPGAAVQRWIVAHVDTKAQGHSMAGRLVAVWLLLLAVGTLTGLVMLRWTSGAPLSDLVVSAATGMAVAAGALCSRSKLRGKTAGARDNGSGLLAALTAADLSADPAIGFVFTGAEEFGLVGARMLVRSGHPVAGCEFINLDTIADRGTLSLVVHNGAGRRLAERLAPALAAGLGIPAVVRHLPVGILVDSVPLARAGGVAFTIGRLDWSVLRLIHTPRDRSDGFDTAAAEAVGRWLSG